MGQPDTTRPPTSGPVPSVGRMVHYVSHGTPPDSTGAQAYPSECRAAVITEVPSGVPDPQTIGLCVLNPTGQFFNRSVPYNDGAEHPGSPDCADRRTHGSPFRYCSCGWSEAALVGGTWHWPERTGT